MSPSPKGPAMKLELVSIPVSDVDRAKTFYEKAGFDWSMSDRPTACGRSIHPPESACSIVFGTGMQKINDMQPGSIKGIHLVVADIATAAMRSPREGSPFAR